MKLIRQCNKTGVTRISLILVLINKTQPHQHLQSATAASTFSLSEKCRVCSNKTGVIKRPSLLLKNELFLDQKCYL
ncbi:hypothetical protein RHGRI_011764 [Rhododendron griersonianum]|uniref:Secreted protein n=1 Tax=Rhododendron griersonianum TaxID=479676 RepID=A0AAV6KN31_9ERIC|nr:hypothetical protein RHGRI_011764 [Rhododendron griersonianum]